MSSLCAPRQSIRRTPFRLHEIKFPPLLLLVVPDRPWCITAAEHVIQLLLLLVGVHTGPKAFMGISHELLLSNQAAKGRFHQFFAVFHVGKDLLAKDKETAIHASAGAADMLDTPDGTVGLGFNQMKTGARLDADKQPNPFALFESADGLRQGNIGQPV